MAKSSSSKSVGFTDDVGAGVGLAMVAASGSKLGSKLAGAAETGVNDHEAAVAREAIDAAAAMVQKLRAQCAPLPLPSPTKRRHRLSRPHRRHCLRHRLTPRPYSP